MKRLSLFAVLPLLLAGCAELFDANVYTAVDAPPALNKANLAKLSTADIKQLAGDSSFYVQLKADPAALTAVQDALNTALTNATTTEDKIDAATTLIEVTANSTEIAEIKAAAVENLTTIQDALKIPDYGKALKIFLGNETDPAKIEPSLNQLVILSNTLATMQTISKKADKTVDPDVFFSGTTDPAGFAQTALMAAVTRALIADMGRNTTSGRTLATTLAAAVTKTAVELAKPTPSFIGVTTDIDAFGAAKAASLAVDAASVIGSSAQPTYANGYSYAYVNAVVSKLALGL